MSDDAYNRQSALDLVSAIENHVPEEFSQAQSIAAAAHIEALIYVGDQVARLADLAEKYWKDSLQEENR